MNTNTECLRLGALEPSETKATSERGPRLGLWLLFLLILAAAGVFVGMKPRLIQREQAAADTHELAIPSVGVVHPAAATTTTPMVFSGELKPLTEASIYARASGYVQEWKADLGAHVKTGQVLATLDTPELDSSLSQARAVLVQAEAAHALADIASQRWKKLQGDNAVSTQEVDEKKGDAALKKAAVDAARADVQRLEELRAFAQITAPFDGTITARNLDVGQLVTAGGTTQLYRIAQTNSLRVFVRIPQSYAHAVEVGQKTELTVPELKGRTFEAKIVRTAGAIDPASRTLLAEIAVDNSKDELFAGSYAQVALAAMNEDASLTVPSNTVLFRAQGTQLAVLDKDGAHVSLRNVKLGRDFGARIEILSGVAMSDRVVMNPADSLVDGLEVRAVDVKEDEVPGIKKH